MFPTMRGSAVIALLFGTAGAFQPERLPTVARSVPLRDVSRATSSEPQSPEDMLSAARVANLRSRRELEMLAIECNPRIRFFDPLGLADKNFWGTSEQATISFLQHAEMKHGRVAMLAFIGYCVQANHLHWPWATPENGFPPPELTPPEQWDILNPISKLQIFFFIAFLEIWSESAGTHYMKPGGKAGRFPPFAFESGWRLPFVLDLWDPFRVTKDMTRSVRRCKLAKEINNGRLAMLGLFSFFVESKVPGAVPLLTWAHAVEPYEGEYMLPFSYWDVVIYYSETAGGSHVSPLTPW